ncbi:MAG TPA: hypothetical protein VKU36_01975 [Candidatus Babeliales bacterium]|nr:hypothetical protein [Candidatus Babeliales bacterium]
MKKVLFSLLLVLSLSSHCMELGKYSKKTTQQIITHLAYEQRTGHVNIAKTYAAHGDSFNAISQNFDQLFDITADPEQQFTKKDLEDAWYINALNVVTTRFNKASIQKIPHTLLSFAMHDEDSIKINKIKELLVYGADCKNNINNNLLIDIAIKRARAKNQNKKDIYLEIAQLLLQNNADPNYQGVLYDKEENHLYINPSAFMLAAGYGDKEYMALLLKSHAHYCYVDIAQQYKENKGYWYDRYGFDPRNLFNMHTGNPQGLLKTIILEIQQLK